MRVFKNRPFARFAERQNITDKELCAVVENANRGLIDADLGGGVIKQRIARPGEGKSGGFRAVIFFRVAHRAFFVFGFAKSDLANISPKDLKAFKIVAKATLILDDLQLQEQLESEELTEVKCDEDL